MRLFVGAVLPPLIGGVLFLLQSIFTGAFFGQSDYIVEILLILGFSYVCMGWQSLFYSFIMEYLVFSNTKAKAIVLPISGGLGFLMSLTLFVILEKAVIKTLLLMLPIGIITGLLVGYILLKLAPAHEIRI